MTDNAIEVKNLTKDYGDGRGIFDFSFAVKKGEICGLVGTNGSGKTTTMRHLMGFIRGDKGSVTVDGLNAWKNAAAVKRKVGYVPGQIDFPDVGTGATFLRLQAALLDLKDFTYMNSLIDRLKIDITAPLRRMSKGMKQKMAIVAAFMAQLDIYLLDEPSTGLDPLMRDTMVEIVLEQKAACKTVFLSSHVFKEIEDTCDRVMFIKNGRLQSFVSRSDYESDPHETYMVSFADEKDYRAYIAPTHTVAGQSVSELSVHRDDAKRAVSISLPVRNTDLFLRDLACFSVASFSHETYSLEKYYTDIIERS